MYEIYATVDGLPDDTTPQEEMSKYSSWLESNIREVRPGSNPSDGFILPYICLTIQH